MIEVYKYYFIDRRILCAAGKQGSVYFWKYIMNSTKKTTSGERLQSLETHWKPLEMITNPDLDLKTGEVRGEKQLAKSMEWGPSINLLYI